MPVTSDRRHVQEAEEKSTQCVVIKPREVDFGKFLLPHLPVEVWMLHLVHALKGPPASIMIVDGAALPS